MRATPLVAGVATAVALLLPATAGAYGLYATTGPGHSISVTDTTNNALVGEITDIGFSPNPIVVSTDGRTAYDGAFNEIYAVATQTNQVSGPVSIGTDANPSSSDALAITPNGKRLYSVNGFTDDVSVINTKSMKRAAPDIPEAGFGGSAVASPDGTRIFFLDNNGLEVIDTSTNTLTGPVNTLGGAGGAFQVLAINPAGTRLYASQGSTVYVINANTYATVTTVASPAATLNDFAVSPDGGSLYTANFLDDTVSTLNTATNTFLPTDIPVSSLNPDTLAFTPDGQSLYVGGNELWEIDPQTRTVIATAIPFASFNPHGIAISKLDPAPPPPKTGKTVNVAPESGKVKVKCKGDRGYQKLSEAEQIKLGCLVDTTKGHVVMTSSAGGGETQSAEFWDGVFKPKQKKAKHPFTELDLPKGQGCSKGKKQQAVAPLRHGKGKHKKKGNKLWGSGKGDYKTKGRRVRRAFAARRGSLTTAATARPTSRSRTASSRSTTTPRTRT